MLRLCEVGMEFGGWEGIRVASYDNLSVRGMRYGMRGAKHLVTFVSTLLSLLVAKKKRSAVALVFRYADRGW